jgi:cytoskeleton protein RodZ
MTKVTRLTLDNDGALERRRIHLREISDDIDAPLDTVGQDLRTARLRRGDDLAAVSRVLKIRKDHLEALEEDRVEALPGRTYAVGFIRSYADYLGLDAVQCVERYKAEIAGRADPTVQPITVIDEDAEHRMPHGWKIMAVAVVILVLIGAYQVAASVDRMMNEKTVEPVPTIVNRPVAHKPIVKPVEQPAPPPAATAPDGQVAPDGTASANAVPGQTPATGQTPAATQPGTQPGTPAPQAAAVPAQPVAAPPLPQGQVYGGNNRSARVVLRARDSVRILVLGRIGADGRPVVYQNRLLKAGDSYRVPNIPGVTLTTSNAGAIQVELDGSVAGVAGKSQETAELISLDPQSIMDRNGGNHGR